MWWRALVLILIGNLCFAQQESVEQKFDLLHTELHLKPIWENQSLEGHAILKLKPFFYAQNLLVLDARGFEIKTISEQNQPANYKYENNQIVLSLHKPYLANDTLKIDILYTAFPNKLALGGSEAITSDKGLYFINPLNKEKNIPRELWTQGETQSNSAWFPTIDSPNQNHTQDFYLEVDKNFTTLSNGLLVGTEQKKDGLKIDHWQMKLPHEVYLSMIAVGPFTKVIDPNFKAFEVSYYLEPKYVKYALNIFGRTPEMIKYFENILNVKYQWPKYAQIPVRRYVSGAMENTTATVHSKSLLKTDRQLVDGNDDGVIAHELFHHWFGDYVTCESWSQLPLNESFANYSEFLWASHHQGKDEGDYVYMTAMQEYLSEAETKQVPLIRFNYANREDMFDAHSYQKGGRVLHQLSMEVGDDAFFKSLNYYLTKNAFQTVEIENLRLAFEKTTGRDLKWFFDQWFLKPGHPRLNIEQKVDHGILKIKVNQITDSTNNLIYRVKLPIEIHENNLKKYHEIILDSANQTFEFPVGSETAKALINPDGYFFGEIKQNKSKNDLIEQYKNATQIYARFEALVKLEEEKQKDAKLPTLADSETRKIYMLALNDTYWRIRSLAVLKFRDYEGDDFLEIEKSIQNIIKTDKNSNVRADAILVSKGFLNSKNEILYKNALKDSSYLVVAASLEALMSNPNTNSDSLALAYKNVDDLHVFGAIADYFSSHPKPEYYDWYIERFQEMEGIEIYQNLPFLGAYLMGSDSTTQMKALPYLKNIGLNASEWFNRVSAAQVLMGISENLPEAKNALIEIVKNEKDERLMRYYGQLKDGQP